MPKDNFSKQAALYAKYRPHYPAELYDFIYKFVSHFDTAWDCATGNGQVASVLSEKFDQVFATDVSQKQLDNAAQKPNTKYTLGSAEQSGLSEKVDLITVAQALHWFDFDSFFKEVQRMSKPTTVLAYWGYGLLKLSKKIDPLIRQFYDVTIGPYWDPERKIVDNGYRDISFPLQNEVRKNFHHTTNLTLEQFHGYLTSWSSVQKYIAAHSHNPVDDLTEQLESLWAPAQTVSFPIFLTVGTVKG